ncbi:MAG: cysteine desulfurase [Ruminococcus sp.]|nr:cysteine desulfurase [Ruminococcus sp.]
MTEHYLDNSATTRVSQGAADKAIELMRECYANPSSLHSMGFSASKELEHARDTIAKALGADSSEIYFTSGGTEANNLAILGCAHAHKRRGNRIVTTATEHSSVYETMLHLRDEGFEVIFVSPDITGGVSAQDVISQIDEKTILVSVMYINNETGATNPITEIAAAIKRRGLSTLLHTDAVQAFGKVDFKVARLGAHLVSISGHKIHAPKGVGALYVKKGVRILPHTFGGKQEKKLRPGTESLPLIGAFGVAAEELDIQQSRDNAQTLRSYLLDKLSLIPQVKVNSPSQGSPFILNFSVDGIRSETMLHHLAAQGVYVSSGSACSKGAKSHVLSAMNLPDNLADSAIRVSFSKHSTHEDCDALLEGIRSGIENLAKR